MKGPFYYAIQLVKGGPSCGFKLWHGNPIDPLTLEILTERSAIWRAEINGEYAVAADVAPWIVDGTGDTVRGKVIDEAEYNHLCNVAKWAQEHAPSDPYAKPRETINLNELPPLKW